MKLAVQENMLPGASFADKAALAEDLGFDGIEIWGHGVGDRLPELKAGLRGRRVTVSTICAGYPGALVVADPELRRSCRGGILAALQAAAELGSVGLIVVPVFNHLRDLPDLSPYASAQELGERLLVAQLREMAPEIEKLGGPCILLEALNRYEADFLRRQRDAARIAREVDSPAVRIMCDLFHMNIEEPSIPAALSDVADVCRHIHLADNTRAEPGSGSLDFRAAMAALREAGFEGFMALECGLSGEPVATLRQTVGFLNSCRQL